MPKKCPEGKIYNPVTGNCIANTKANRDRIAATAPKKSAAAPKRASKSASRKSAKRSSAKKTCPEGKILNPATGRCILDNPANRAKVGMKPAKKARSAASKRSSTTKRSSTKRSSTKSAKPSSKKTSDDDLLQRYLFQYTWSPYGCISRNINLDLIIEYSSNMNINGYNSSFKCWNSVENAKKIINDPKLRAEYNKNKHKIVKSKEWPTSREQFTEFCKPMYHYSYVPPPQYSYVPPQPVAPQVQEKFCTKAIDCAKKRIDLYRVLDVGRNASAADVLRAYRKLALKFHPDKGGNRECFDLMTNAKQILSDTLEKLSYETWTKVYGEAKYPSSHQAFLDDCASR